jgi:hypothetical protein
VENAAAITTEPGRGDQGTVGEAQDKAKEVASQAQDRAREAAGEARGRLRNQVNERSTQIGERVGAGAGDARSVADELRKQGKDTPARYLDQAADRAERFGDYFKESDGDTILRDIEDRARRNPWAVAVGGLALGFAASRMLKASSSERYRASRSSAPDTSGDVATARSVNVADGQGTSGGFDPGS